MQEAENVWFEEPCILYNILWKVVHEGQGMCGSSNCMFPVPSRRKQDARGRECAVRRTTHSLSRSVGNCAQETENVRFFEPHVLSPVSQETVCKGQRMCGLKNHTFSVLFCRKWYVRGYTTGRECAV